MLGQSASTPKLSALASADGPVSSTTTTTTTTTAGKDKDKDEPRGGTERRFTSNLCAVLNDPRKDRTKINYLFTKTWGTDFIDNPIYPSIQQMHPKYAGIKSIDFRDYIHRIGNKHEKHKRNKVDLTAPGSDKPAKMSEKSESGQLLQSDLDQIPQIFFDSNFSLENKEIFNKIISASLFVKRKQSLAPNPFNTGVPEAQSCKDVLNKLSYYLDITETHISRQISTKANTFFFAMTSQDEVQEHILKTCKAVKSLRKTINDLDKDVLLISIRALKLVILKSKYKKLIEKLELMSTVYQTQPTIQLHLASSEFTGALDLIAMSQDILRQDLRGVRSLRHFDSQFTEIEKAVDKMLHQEFSKYVISDLSRPFIQGDEAFNQEKLSSLMFGIFRIKQSPFVELFKDEILNYLNLAVKQTVVEFISQLDDGSDSASNPNEEISIRIRNLKTQEFLQLLSKVLNNVKIMLGRVSSITTIIKDVLNLAASSQSLSSRSDGKILNQKIVHKSSVNIGDKEIINTASHGRFTASLNEVLVTSTDYAQERLINLLEGKFKEKSIEKLNTIDFISLTNVIEQFVSDFDLISMKKTAVLRSWLQNQANKFLQKFHAERKEKLSLSLDSERWRPAEIPSEIQYQIDVFIEKKLLVLSSNRELSEVAKNYKSQLPKLVGSGGNNGGVSQINEHLLINGEKYVIFGTTIVLIKLMMEYCNFCNEMPTLCFDLMTRVIEIFRIYNSRIFQLILNVDAIKSGSLKKITFKVLAITYRCLELVLFFIPLLRDFFIDKLEEKTTNISKQFTQLIKDFSDHKSELYNKLVSTMDENFVDSLSKYEVIAPVPSQCVRSICTLIAKSHEAINDILSNATLVSLFTEIHLKFKENLRKRLVELNVQNDGGPQHALVFSDMSYYIKQFKLLNGLHLITLNFEDVWHT